MIRIRGLEVVFNGRIVLSIPNAVFYDNSVILGPNGAGKTTLLKTIIGLYKPLHGYIEVDGIDILRVPAYRLLSTNIETAYIMPGARLNDLVEIYCSAFNCDIQSVKQLLSYLKPKAREFWKLSAGEKKWVSTILALHADTRITLLDEPFEDLDPWLVKKLVVEIQKFSEHKQIALTLHSIYLLREFENWDLFFMFDGTLYGSIKSREVFNAEIVPGRNPEALLTLKIHGEEYSLVKSGVGKGIPLREISDLTQLYSRSKLGL